MVLTCLLEIASQSMDLVYEHSQYDQWRERGFFVLTFTLTSIFFQSADNRNQIPLLAFSVIDALLQ